MQLLGVLVSRGQEKAVTVTCWGYVQVEEPTNEDEELGACCLISNFQIIYQLSVEGGCDSLKAKHLASFFRAKCQTQFEKFPPNDTAAKKA